MNNDVKTIRSQTGRLPTEGLLEYLAEKFAQKIALASSMSAEDQVVTDMLCRIQPRVGIFTLDTGRLPQETYDLIDATNQKYGIRIKVMFPESSDVEALLNEEGPNSFYKSIESRKRCCHVRKVLPLRRALSGLDAWITGLRREQSVTRDALEKVEWDESNGLIKVNPLAEWTSQQVWDYIRANDVPYSKLHDQGYPSIGCAPCTRAIEPGQDDRAGRWWWEQPEHKECGLHLKDGKLQPTKEQ